MRPLLHAAELILPHPAPHMVLNGLTGAPGGGAELRLRCAPPADFGAVAALVLGRPLSLAEALGDVLSDGDGAERSGGGSEAGPQSALSAQAAPFASAASAAASEADDGRGVGAVAAALLVAAETSKNGWYD
jgi:hypothetical protein